MIKKGALISALLLSCSLVAPSRAGDAGRETVFVLGAGARALGMGGGLSSLADDATAIYYNPALLSGLEYQEVAFTHSILLENSIYDFASWVFPITENHGLGVGYMRVGTGDIVRRIDYADRGSFDFAHSQFLVSYGRNFGEPVSAGISLKIVNMQLAAVSDYGVGFDAGLAGTVYKNLSFGIMARDILQAKMELAATTEEAPFSVTGGFSASDLTISDQVALALSVDLEKFEDRSLKVHAGAEVLLHHALSLRGGYDRDNLALGVGIRRGRLSVNYAYKLVDHVENIHQFSLSFFIGPSVAEQIQRREAALRPPEPTEEEKILLALNEKANRYFHQFRLDSAAYYYRQALGLSPGDQEIIGTIAAIERAIQIQRQQEERLQQMERELRQTLLSFLSQAELLYSQGAYSASLDLLELIFDIDPDNRRAGNLKIIIEEGRAAEIESSLQSSRIAMEEGRLADAIEAYHRVLEIDPDNKEALESRQQVLATMDIQEKIHLAIELYEKGHYDEAAVQFRAVLAASPEEPMALQYLGQIEDTRAEAATLEDLQKDPQAWALYLEGLRHMRNKDYQAAIEAWERVLEAYPDNSNTLNNIEQARLRLGAGKPEN